ncbi:ferric reductase-like transmembrane domain-containing protein [Actinomadura alba]|uniref:Ferric reductase-like transmembrane domain-containing protein n=1 Tax=Actinomadura alba TaxID=406431 RepID=A0ABR7LYZ8_9ACTN|nr:ferric reductase-like transmembrane domain-containing protein [Actinomadura alba]MBC6469603.1 ferric reductase-like transmembrane domain-containing protein [Actinomadura alba]
MTVIVIVACLVTAGAELFLARGARRVADRLERLEALTLRQDERMDSMSARLRSAGPVAGARAGTGAGGLHIGAVDTGRADTGRADTGRTDTGRVDTGTVDAGLLRVTDETARLRERLSALEDARRVDRDLYAHLDGAVESLERVVANVFRLTVGELDQAAAGTLRGAPAEPRARHGSATADTVDLGHPRRRGRRPAGVVALVLATAAGAPVGAAVLGQTGAAILSQLHRFLTTYGGVLALVASTLSVAAGLIASDRVLFSIRQRILAQAAHRAASLITLAFLLAHVAVMVLTRHASALQAILPVGAAPLAIGTVAAHLLVLVSLTGLARRRFADGRRPGLWRVAHRLAYVGWALAILHGLLAGRRPPAWVTWSYALSLAGASMALLTRAVVIMRSRGAAAPGTRPRPRPDRRAADLPGTDREGPDRRRSLELPVKAER